MSEKKKFILNCDVCDARKIKEESLSEYEQIIINADLILVERQLRDRQRHGVSEKDRAVRERKAGHSFRRREGYGKCPEDLCQWQRQIPREHGSFSGQDACQRRGAVYSG